MKNRVIAASLVVCLSAGMSAAIPDPQGLPNELYLFRESPRVSADGTSIVVSAVQVNTGEYRLYTLRSGSWTYRDSDTLFDDSMGISGDGQTQLVSSLHSFDLRSLYLESNGERRLITSLPWIPPLPSVSLRIVGGLTRSGSTVFYLPAVDLNAPTSMVRRYNSLTQSDEALAVTPAGMGFVTELLTSGRDDFFAINTSLEPRDPRAAQRSLLYDNGAWLTIPAVPGTDTGFSSTVSAVNNDGSIVVGVQTSSAPDGAESTTSSWIMEDGEFSELRISNIDEFAISNISDDGDTMVGSGHRVDGVSDTFVVFADGTSRTAFELLADHGFDASDAIGGEVHHVSADGSTIVGTLTYASDYSTYGVTRVFSVTVPAPSSALAMLGLGLFARRRR